MGWLIAWWNRIRGYGFDWDGTTIIARPGTCPYPVINDWSAKACVKGGHCGCERVPK